jgi:hypothetical protein
MSSKSNYIVCLLSDIFTLSKFRENVTLIGLVVSFAALGAIALILNVRFIRNSVKG